VNINHECKINEGNENSLVVHYPIPKCCCEMRVRNFFNADRVYRSIVLLGFFLLELLNSYLSMINCQEIYQFLKILDIFVCYFYRCLEVQDAVFLAGFTLEDTFESLFS